MLLRLLSYALMERDYKGFRQLLEQFDNSEIRPFIDCIKDTDLGIDRKEAIFNTLFDIKYRGDQTMTLVRYMTEWGLSSKFICQYMFNLLKDGYDITTTESARMDGVLMTREILFRSDKDQLLEMLSYHPDLSQETFDASNKVINLLSDTVCCMEPELLNILLQYGVGDHNMRLSIIEDVISILKESYDVDPDDLNNSFIDDYIRNDVTKFMQMLDYLRQNIS